MSAQHHFAPRDQWDRDLYARERVLNSAIIAADISSGWEEYLEIFDACYADDVEVTADTETGPIRGKSRIRALLFNFLTALHVMAEIGGLSIQIRESPIRPGRWIWSGRHAGRATLPGAPFEDGPAPLVYERHYDHQQTGGPLTGDDLNLSPSPVILGDYRPS
jgi:hypothetical protein